MTINTNVDPYYNDYDESKGFYKILFKPGFAVQARELTQLQTNLQKQIERFGKHVFINGSQVLGCNNYYDTNLYHLSVEANANVSFFPNKIVRGVTSGARMFVLLVAQRTETEPNTLVGNMLNGIDFIPGENIEDDLGVDMNLNATVTNSSPNFGRSSAFSIDEGVFFINDHFVFCNKQSIIVDKYDTAGSYVIGLVVSESVVNADLDPTLLDPAQGSYNFAAPGADRYKIDLVLSKFDLGNAPTDFIEVARVANGALVSRVKYPIYSEIEKTLARRTYDESGDYTVRPFSIQIRDNNDPDLITVGMEPGKAYVKGFEFETISTTFLETDKARDEQEVDDIISAPLGSYVLVDDLDGVFNTTASDLVELHDDVATNVTDDTTKIGTARVRYLQVDSGTGPYVYRLYLFDIRMESGSFADVLSVIRFSGMSVVASANINSGSINSGGATILSESGIGSLLFRLPQEVISTVKDSGDDSRVDYVTQRVFTNISFVNGVTVFQTANGRERFFPGAGALSPTATRNYTVIVTNAGTSSFTVGEVLSFESNGSIVISTPVLNSPNDITFDVDENVSFTATIYATISVNDEPHKIKTLTNGLRIISVPNTVAGRRDSLQRSDVYDIINIAEFREQQTGDGGTTVFPLGFTATNIDNLIVTVNGVIPDPYPTLVSNALVFSVAPTNGHQIRVYFTITSRYTLDTGQRDDFYDHGSIILKQGETPPTTEIAIRYRYFTHSGVGYASVDSYSSLALENIPTYTSPTTGEVFRLGNVLDFRPRRADLDVNENFALSGTEIPVPNTFIDAVWRYYLGRIDRICLSKDREFKIIKGISSLNPQTPKEPDDCFTLYILTIPPYTFNVSDVGIRYIENKRYTMRDIGRLEKRIENLEYYTALSLLEKRARDENIQDNTGTDIFKNGILVDAFAGHGVGDVQNADYRCSIDFTRRELRAPFRSSNVRFAIDSLSNVTRTGDLLTLNYTSEEVILQPMASKSVNINPFDVVNWTGRLSLTPPSDTWFDTERRPDVLVNLSGENDAWEVIDEQLGLFGTQWNDWETNWVGEEVIRSEDRNTGWRRTGEFGGQQQIRQTIRRDTVEITTSQIRTGTGNMIVPETITETIGDRVVNISIIPTIRSQNIVGVSKGMKPETRLYAFFDGTDVSEYIKPANSIAVSSLVGMFNDSDGIQELITGGTSGATASLICFAGSRNRLYVINQTGNFQNGETITGDISGATATVVTEDIPLLGDDLVSNTSGEVAFIFALPNTDEVNFKTGERLFRIIDNSSNNVAVSTTSAEARFSASGILQTVEGVTVSTRVPTLQRVSLTDERIITDVVQRDTVIATEWIDPLAQTFLVDANVYRNGMFLTSIDIFFRTKDAAVPVTFQIRPTVNGYPSSGIIVPFSEVIQYPDQINIADAPDANDSDTWTRFTFSSPVYLAPGEYAFVLLSNSLNYEVFVSEFGQTDLVTGELISKQPYAGVMFKSQNSSTWTATQEEDIMFRINKAVFTTSGAVEFDSLAVAGGFSYDLLHINGGLLEIGPARANFGIKTTISNTLDSTFAGILFNQNVELTSRRDLQVEGDLRVRAEFTGSSDVSPVIDVQRINAIVVRNIIDNLSLAGSFAYMTNNGSGYTTVPTVAVSGGNGVGATATATLTPTTIASITVNSGGTGYTSPPTVTITGGGGSGATATASLSGDVVDVITLDTPGSGYTSPPTVTLSGGGGGGAVATAVLTATSVAGVSIASGGAGYTTTPTLTISGGGGSGATAIVLGETSSRGGNAAARYITRRVMLADGFDASNLRVFFSAYRPSGTSINVYYKVLSSEDTEAFDDKDYNLMNLATSSTVVSSSRTDFREYQYIPTITPIQYTSAAGGTFEKFKTFAVKIVMSSSNPSIVPRIKDLRAIALDE